MAYYCFNEDCNRWGDAQAVGIVATWPEPGKAGRCDECSFPLIRHDTWDRREVRYGDDGKPIK